MPQPWEMNWGTPQPGGTYAVAPNPVIAHRAAQNDAIRAQENQRAAAAASLAAKARNDAHAKDVVDLKAKGYDLHPDGSITPVVSSVTSNLTGQDYLASIPKIRAEKANAIIDGRLPLSPRQLVAPDWKQTIDDVVQADPAFDLTKPGERGKARAALVSGADAKDVKFYNTALEHQGRLASQISGTAGHAFTPANSVENAFDQHILGQSGITDYNKTASDLAGETTNFFRNGGGAEADLTRFLANNSPNQSTAQKKSGTFNNIHDISSRFDALQTKYKQLLGPNFNLGDFISPQAKQVLETYAPEKLADYGLTPSGHAPQPFAPAPQQGGGSPPPLFADVPGGPPAGGPPPGSPPGPIGPIPGGPNVGAPGGITSGRTYSTPQDLAVAKAVQDALVAHKGVEGMAAAAKAAGYDTSLSDLGEWKKAADFYEAHGRYSPVVAAQSGNRSPIAQAAGAALMTPEGTALASAVNAAGFGALHAIAPDQMTGLDALNPGSSMAGDVAGTIAGTGALGKVAGMGIGKIAAKVGGDAPAIAQAILAAQGKTGLAKEALTNTVYGGIRGSLENGDPVGGAGAAALGTGLGLGVGKLAGRVASGAQIKAAAQLLRDRGVPLTVGQLMGGGVQKLENAATSLPFVGNQVAARYGEGFQGFNRAAFQDAGAPIGASTPSIGNMGVQDLRQQASGAYDRATAGANVPLDAQFGQDMAQAGQAGAQLRPDLATGFDQAWKNRIGPIMDQGAMTGDSYQQTMRGLSGYKAEVTKPGFEQDYRDAISKAQDALKAQMLRGGGRDVVSGLGQADQAWRGASILDKAVQAAKNGSGSGEVQTFTPAQLNNADYASNNKYGGGLMFGDLADAGQTVLPSKVPDSGTGARLALQTLLGAGTLGAGAGYSSGGGEGAAGGAGTGLGILGLLSAGATKPGQKLLIKALIDRPDWLKTFGGQIGQQSGLFGRAAVPLLMDQGN